MRVLVFLAIISLPACSTTQSESSLGEDEPGVITSSNAGFGRNQAVTPRPRCKSGSVLVCNSDEDDAQCGCESNQRFRFERSLPRSISVHQ